MIALGGISKYYQGGGGGATPPAFTVAPVVSGTAVVGQTLTCDGGTATGTEPITRTYQWQRDGVDIGGATASTYLLVQADAGNTSNIKCVVTATNSAGSASADSNTIVQILDATAAALITAASIVDTTQIAAANFEMYTMKAGGVTSGYVGLYPIIGGTGAKHKWNMFNPVDSDAAKRLVFSGTITHSANGMQGNGTNGVANSFINPSMDLNGDFAGWFYSRTATTSTSLSDFGVIEAGLNPGVLMGVRTHTTNFFGANANLNGALAAIANSGGFFLMKRVGNDVTIKRNNVTIHTFTAANTVYANGLIRLMASMLLPASTINYSNKQYTDFGFVKATFTAGMDTGVYNAVLGKETILSRNV